MSESGFTRFPEGPNLPGMQKRTDAGKPNARLIGVPNELREVRTPLTLRGEVVREPQSNSDTVRVHTESGNIDLRLDRGQAPPREGERVEIRIRPGRPPERAAIRRAPPNPQHMPGGRAQEIRHDQTGAKSPDAQQTQGTPPRHADTPVNVELGARRAADTLNIRAPDIQTLNRAAPAQTLPPAGSTIRLEPLSPAQAEILLRAPEITLQVINSLMQAVSFQTELSVIRAQDFLLAETLTIQKPNTGFPVQITALPPAAPTLPVSTPQIPADNFSPVLQNLTLVSYTETAPPRHTFFALQFNPVDADAAPAPAREAVFSNLNAAPGLNGFLPLQAAQLQAAMPLQQPLLIQDIPPLPQAGLRAPPVIDVRLEAVISPAPLLGPPIQGEAATDTKSDARALPARLAAQRPLILEDVKAGTLKAFITGALPDSRPVLSLTMPGMQNAQSFALQFPVETVPAGTVLHIMPLDVSPASGAIASSPAALTPVQILAPLSPWPVMTELYQTLAQSQPALAQVLSNMTPSPANPAQMSPAALFFIAAMRAGDITGWLGNKTIDSLRRDGRTSLLSRITGENGLLSRLAGEPLSQDWRALSLPLFWEGQVDKIALYYRHEDGGAEQDEPEGRGTRFVFDLALSRMGKVQLDGLHRSKRLDLILRSEQTLSQAMRQNMRGLYSRALKTAAFTGELSFQGGEEGWVTIQAASKDTMEVSA